MIASPSEKIKVDIDGHVATLVIDNPAANTWDTESLPALQQVVEVLNASPEIYALVLTGAGDKFFSAGADLKLFADVDPETAPVAAINGFAMGGGLEVAMACDIRVAESQAKLALPEATVGLLPCAGGTQRLAQLVGEGWAKRMILCGERISAARALEIGLVEEVVEPGTALQVATQLAASAGAQSPTSVAACKRLIHGARNITIAGGLAAERSEFVNLFSTEDQREGVNAFLEKRPPEWKNR